MLKLKLKDFFNPEWDIEKGVRQLYEAYKAHGLTYEEFTGNKIENGRLREAIHLCNRMRELLKEIAFCVDLRGPT